MILVLALFASLAVAGCSQPAPAPLHGSFDLTGEQLKAMIEPLPENIRETILAQPSRFLDRLADVLKTPDELLVVVDKEHNIGSSYVPPDLVSLDRYPLATNRAGLMLRAVVLPDALAMSEAAKQDGIRLIFSSTYRSYDYQETVYARNVAELGQEQADRESARPGASQHQLGTVVDFGSITDAFADTPAGKWLYANAWKYGFSLSYPDGYESVTGYRHEIWHYRYISRPAAYLERYFFHSVQHYLLSFLETNRAALEAAFHDSNGPDSAVAGG